MVCKTINIKKIRNSHLFKDSFWAVFGSGLGNALLLVAGIVIARILGKDLYGEYGMVKTTMFHIASFSTLGLGFTSTKYIANAVVNSQGNLRGIIRTSILTTFGFSLFLCILLFIFADTLALYIEEPKSSAAFRALGIIIVFRAVNTICTGLLSGYKQFKRVGINNIVSGGIMLVLASVLTYIFGLLGSFISLAIAQFMNALLNFAAIIKEYKEGIDEQCHNDLNKDMLIFTIPVAIQEFSWMLCTWGGTMILTKYSSLGEVGLWSVASQWNAIILFVPQLLSNVVLSHLSSLSKDKNGHTRMLKKMLVINFICSFIPFIVVYILADLISSFYGPTFSGLNDVIRVLIFSTIIACLSSVFHSSLLSEDRNWTLLVCRAIRDMLMLSILFVALKKGVENASLSYSWIYVFSYLIYLCLLAMSEIVYKKKEDKISVIS